MESRTPYNGRKHPYKDEERGPSIHTVICLLVRHESFGLVNNEI
ncbi:hypothetical protein BN903_40 [Halorubrum sp. AJ67]|nr:hypothetical protein BN903_40 [Halorubrum sp. AJ67]